MSDANNGLGRINHIVVLMLENRFFDNVLGWLYDPDHQPPFDSVPRGQSFEGLSGTDLSNPRPGGGVARIGRGSSYTDPFPDPFEPYTEVFAQMYNRNPPPTPIPVTEDSPDMQGFVINYAAAIVEASKSAVGGAAAIDPGLIMNCFTPDQLPVISGLANAYAVCDYWFSSIPTQTDGHAILKYIRETAAEFGVDRKIRYGHRVRRASELRERSCDASVRARRQRGDGVQGVARRGRSGSTASRPWTHSAIRSPSATCSKTERFAGR